MSRGNSSVYPIPGREARFTGVAGSDGMTLLEYYIGQAMASGNCPSSHNRYGRAGWYIKEANAVIEALDIMEE